MDFQKILNEAHIFLALEERHRTAFWQKSPITGWHAALSLLDYLVRVKITKKDTKESKGPQCNRKPCKVCQNIEETGQFEAADGDKHNISKRIMNCYTNFTVYFLVLNDLQEAIELIFIDLISRIELIFIDLTSRHDNRMELRRRESF